VGLGVLVRDSSGLVIAARSFPLMISGDFSQTFALRWWRLFGLLWRLVFFVWCWSLITGTYFVYCIKWVLVWRVGNGG
jgi:hypothetical protein